MKTAADHGEVEKPVPIHGSSGGTPDAGRDAASRGRRRWHQLAGAVGVLAVGVAATVGALDLGYWKRGPGPGFFPVWMGLLLTVLAVLWAVQVHRGRALPHQEPAAEGSVRRVVLVVVGLTAAVLLLNVIGYQLAMFLLVLYVLLVIGRRRWLESLVFAAVAGFGIYTLFASVLKVYLPTASLEFLAGLGL